MNRLNLATDEAENLLIFAHILSPSKWIYCSGPMDFCLTYWSVMMEITLSANLASGTQLSQNYNMTHTFSIVL